LAQPAARIVVLRAGRAGGVFALAGLLASLGFVLQSESPAEQLRLLAAPVGVASFGVGAICWTALCQPTSTHARGALFGLVTHVPAMLLLMLTVGRLEGMEQRLSVGASVATALYFAFFSLLSFGWLSVSLGIATGLALPRWEARVRVP
jgi:hypothetical protein